MACDNRLFLSCVIQIKLDKLEPETYEALSQVKVPDDVVYAEKLEASVVATDSLYTLDPMVGSAVMTGAAPGLRQ